MKLLKRITGFILALMLMISTVPAYALTADATTYTGVDVRVCHATIDKKVIDASLSVQVATDEQATQYQPDNSITHSETWYHTTSTLEQVPEEDRSRYSAYTYGTTSAYVRAVDGDEVFAEDEQYLCVITLTPNEGVFHEDCIYTPTKSVYANIGANTATVYLSVTPLAEDTIEWINFTCTNTGLLQIYEHNPDYVYLYKTSDGSEIIDSVAGEPIGKHIIYNAEYQIVDEQIEVTNQPCITLYAVSVDEWYSGSTSAVIAYGTYTIPMSDPYIEVDTLQFGQYITVTEIGTTTGGKYHWSIANATFEGWFVDKEGKQPATAEADAYVIFNLRSYGLFDPDIEANNFTLKCGNERYVGAYLLPRTSSNAYKIAFFVPSNRISFTLEVIGEGGTMTFVNHPNANTISLKPMSSGKYPSQDIDITIEPGFYAKSLKVNGEVWQDIRHPFKPYANLTISNDRPFHTGIPSFEPVGNTVITLELAPADRITIDYGNNSPAYTGPYADENKWHENAQYWVSETYTTQLCIATAIIKPDYRQHLKSLNTKPDGTGIDVPITANYFMWQLHEEYQNGKRDEITLYAIMECDAHIQYGAVEAFWSYRDAKPATCTEEGWIAHRYCERCGQYQIQNESGSYIAVLPNAVKLDKIAHQHTVYIQHSDEQHAVQCAHCEDRYTESHTIENGVCVCGYFTYVKGDFDGNGYVTDADAVHLLYYTIFSEDYPINQPADFTGDGYVTDADAVHLLYYTIFPEDYPL